jgi:hypothetical protein
MTIDLDRETLRQCERVLAALAELRAAIGDGPTLTRTRTKRHVEMWGEMWGDYYDLKKHCERNLT